MIRIYHKLFKYFLDSHSFVSNFVVITHNLLKLMTSCTGTYVSAGYAPKDVHWVKGVHTYLTAVASFLEKKKIEAIRILTSHHENTLWPAFALEINVRAPFNFGFNHIAVLIFTSVTPLQLESFFQMILPFYQETWTIDLNINLKHVIC